MDLKSETLSVAATRTHSIGLIMHDHPSVLGFRKFSDVSEPDYARSGNIATQTVIIEQGPLTSFSHALEPHLRQLGLPTSLQKG